MNNRHLKINFLNIIIIGLISFSFSFVISQYIYKIPAYQKIEFFISSTYVDSEYFVDTISTNNTIKKVNIIPRSVNSDYYEQTLLTIGIYSDLLIISDKYLDTEDKYFSFSSIDYTYFEDAGIDLSKFELVTSNNKCYGVVVFDKEKNINLFKDQIVFENEDRYILLIGNTTPNSINNPTNKKETNNAFTSFMELLKRSLEN